MSQRGTPRQRKAMESSALSGTPPSSRSRPVVSFPSFVREPSLGQASSVRGKSTASHKPTSSRRVSMVPRLRVPVHEDLDDDDGGGGGGAAHAADYGRSPTSASGRGFSPDVFSSSQFRGASPSIVSMARMGSVVSDGGVPPPPDIQHIEGELWYVTGKNIPGKKKRASPQWVVCEDNRVSVYSSWAKSSRQLEEKQFERVKILFDFLHPHKHPSEIGGSTPQTRRMTLMRNQARTTQETKQVFSVRDPLATKGLAGYYYFGIECVLRDATTGKLRRFLEIFATDHADDHRKWIDFWEEMQLRYPMVRIRDANMNSMDIGAEWLTDFVFPTGEEGQSPRPKDPDGASSYMPSPIDREDDDNDRFASTRAPRVGELPSACSSPLTLPDGSLSLIKASGSSPPSVAAAEAAHAGEKQTVRRDLFRSADLVGGEAWPEWMSYLADTERKARESVECTEAALRSLFEANYTLRTSAMQALSLDAIPPAAVSASEAAAGATGGKDDAAPRPHNADVSLVAALQWELQALCAALVDGQEGGVRGTAPPQQPQDVSLATEATWKSPHLADSESGPTVEDHVQELRELREENARLHAELDAFAATAEDRVVVALSAWSEADATASETTTAVDDRPFPPDDAVTRYLLADDALVRALVEAAVGRGLPTRSPRASMPDGCRDPTAPPSRASVVSLPTESSPVQLEPITEGEAGGTETQSTPTALTAPPAEASAAHDAAEARYPPPLRQQLAHFSEEHVRRLGSTAAPPPSENCVSTAQLRAMASALGVPANAFAGVGSDGERVPTVEQLVDRCAALAAAAAREEESAAEAAALRDVVESVVGPMQAGDGGAALAAKRAELEEAEAALSGATGKKARAAAEARVAALRAEVVELEAAEAERAAPSAEDYAAAVEERLRDLAAHDERVSNSVKSEPQVTTHHGHVFDGAEWEGVARDRPAALRDALVGDVSAACRVGAEDVSNVAFEPDTGRATFDVTHNAVVSEEEMERRLAECGYPRMYALYERRGDAVDGADALAAELAKAAAERDAELRAMARALGVPADAFAGVGSDGERVPTVEQLVDRCTALAAARASEAEGLRAMASALGVPEDVFAAADEDGERVPTVEQLVDRCTALAAARASEAEGLRAMASALGVPEDVFAAADEDGERVPTVEQLVDRCAALAAARASEAEGLRAMASALGVPEDVFAAADEDGERVPTVEQLVDRCAALAAAAAREEESAAEAAALRDVVESVVGPVQAGDGGAALAAKRAELEEAEAALSGATGKKARAAAEARVAALRAEVVELEAAEAERAAPSAEDYAAAVEERLRDLAAHDERVSNSVKSEPQVTTHHGHVFDGAEWEGVARDRPAALRDALVGDVSAACRVGAEDVSNVAFEPDTGRATFDVTHNAVVSEEEMERRLAECGYPRMYALYERRGDAVDGADALAAELAKAAAERDAELRAMARALGVPADAFAGVGSDGERVPTVEQLVDRCTALAAARASEAEGLRAMASALGVPEDVFAAADEDGERVPTVEQLVDRCAALAAARASEAEGLRAMASALGVPEDVFAAADEDGERVPTVEQLVDRCAALAAARASEAEGLRAMASALGVPEDVFAAADEDGERVPTVEQLVDRCAALAAARVSEAEGLRAMASALGVPEDVFAAADEDGERVPTVEQLVDRCAALAAARASEAEGLRAMASALGVPEDVFAAADEDGERVPTVEQLVDRCAALAAARVSEAEGLRAMASALGVPEDVFAAADEDGERVPTVEQLVDRCAALAAAAAREEESAAEAAALRDVVESVVGPVQAGDGGAALAAKRAELEEAEAALSGATGKKARAAAEARVAALRAEVVELEAAEAERAAPSAEDYAAAVEERLRDLAAHDERVSNSVKSEPQVTTHHGHVFDGAEWEGVARDRPAALRDALVGDVSAACRVGAEDVSNVAFEPDTGRATFDVTHNAVVSEEEMERRLAECGYPRMYALYERRGDAVDGADALAAELAKAAAERDAELRAMARALGVPADAFAGVGSDGERVPTVEQLVDRCAALAAARASEAEGLRAMASALGVPEDVFAAADEDGERVPTVEQLVDRCAALAAARASEAEGLRAMASALGVPEDVFAAADEDGERVPTVEQLVDRCAALAAARASEAEGLRAMASALGVPEDVFAAADDDGERVPTVEQLVDRCTALAAARASEAEGLRAMASALGVPEDVFAAADEDGERVPTVEQLVDRCTALAAARVSEAEGLRAMASALGVPEDVFAAADEDGERVPTVEQLVDRCTALAAAAAREEESAAEAAALRDVVESVVGPVQAGDGGAALAAKRAELEEAEAALSGATGKKARAAAEARVAALRAEVVELEAAEAERAAPSAEDYAAAVEERLRDLAAHDERVSNSVKSEPQVTTHHGHVFDGAEWEGVARDRPAALRDALVGDVSADCRVGAEDVSNVAFEPDTGRATFDVTHNAVVSEEEMERLLAECGYPRMYALYERRGDAVDGADALAAELAKAAAERDAELRAMARALGVPADAFAGVGSDGERVPTVEQLVDRCAALAAARASEAEGLRAMASALGVPEDVFAAADEDGERVPTVEQLVDRCTALAAARVSEAEGLRAMASALGVPEDVFAAADEDGERVPTVEQLVDRCTALAAAAAREEESAAEAAALRDVVESVVGPVQAGDGGAALAAKRAELEEAEAALSGATGKKARAAAEARVAALRAEVVELEAAEAERAAPSAEDYAAAVEERLRDLAAHDERVSNSVKSEPQVTTHHGHVFDGAEWEGVARDRPAALRDALVGDVSAACRVGAEDVSNVAFEPDTGRATFDVTHNAVVSEEEMERRLAECGYPRMYALYERRGDAVDGADALAAELAKAAAERDAELRAMARALGVPADAFAGVGSDGERVPTVEQLVDRCTALAAARASEAESAAEAAALRHVVESVVGPMQAGDGGAALAAKRAELEEAEAALSGATGKKARAAAEARVAALRAEVVELEAAEAERAAPSAEDYAAAVEERLRDLAAHDERVSNSVKSEPQVTTHHGHVFDGAEWEGVARDRPAALRDALVGDVSAACRVGAEDVSNVAFEPDTGRATFDVTHNAVVSEEEMERRLAECGYPRMYALYERRGDALDGADALAAELAKAAAERDAELRAMARALGVPADAFAGVGSDGERVPTVEQLVDRCAALAAARASEAEGLRAMASALGVPEDVFAAADEDGERVPTVEQLVDRCTALAAARASEAEGLRAMASALGVPEDVFAAADEDGERVPTVEQLVDRCAALAAARASEAEGLRAMASALGVPEDVFAAADEDGERVPTVEQLVDRCTALAAARASEAEGLRAMASALGVPEDVFAAADEDGERVPTVEQLVDRCTALAAARASEAEGLRAMASALGVPEDVFAAADEDGERVPTVEQLVDRCTALAAARTSEAEGLRAMASALGVPEDVFAAADEDGERVPTVEQLVDRCAALAAARASEAEGLRAMASALGVPEDVFAAADEDGERVPTVEQLVDRCTALAAARASEAEGLRAMASALGVPEDVFAAADEDGERVPTVEQLVDRCAALAAARASEAEGLRAMASALGVPEDVFAAADEDGERVPTVEQLVDRCTALAAARASEAEGLRAMASALGVPEDVFAAADEDGERVPTVEQLVDRCAALAAAAAREEESAAEAAALRHVVESVVGPMQAGDGGAALAAKRAELEEAEAALSGATGKKARAAAEARVAALRAEVVELEAAEAERAAPSAEDYAAAVEERLRDLAAHDERVSNSVKSEPQVTTHHGHVFDGAEWEGVARDRPAALRDALVGDVSAACRVGAEDVSNVAFEPDTGRATFDVTHNAVVSEEEMERRLAECGYPRMYALYERRGDAVDGADALAAELAKAAAERDAELRAMARALGVPADAFAAVGSDGERVPTVEQLVDRCTALAAARASEAEGLRAMASALGVPEDVFAAADDDGERVPTVEQLVDRCAALAAAAAREEESAAEAAALRHVVESVVGPMQAGDGGAALAAKRAELEEAEAALSGATGKKARAAAEARVAALRAEVVELEAAEAERAAPSAEDYAAAVEERLRDLAAHDERVSNSVKSEPQVTTHHGHVFDGAEWEGVARDRPAALRDALVGDVSAACRVGAEDVSNVAFEPDTGRATFDVTHNAVVSEEEMERRLAECGYPRMYALYERRGDAVDGADALAAELAKAAAERDAELRAMARALGVPADAFAAVGSDGERVPTVEQLVDRCTALAAARASEAEGLRAMASALGVPEDVFAAADEDGERVPTVEQLVDRCTALAAARASEAEGLRAMASALGVPEDVFAAADDDGERVPTVEQLVDRCAALAAAAAREEESAAEAAALRDVVESVVGPMQAGDGGAALAAKRAELEEAEAALSGATGKKARAAAEARVAALRAEVVELEAAEAERAAPSAEDYAAAVEERLRDLAAHDERVSNSVKSEPQVTTHHGHVFDGAEWEGVARDRPAALRDALVGDVSAACRVGAEDVSNVAFEPDTGRATFDVTHNAVVSEEEMERRLAECGYPRMYALYERRGDAVDGADALAAELAKAAAERDAELRAMARALGVPADAFAAVGSDGERVPTVEQLVDRCTALAAARASEAEGLRAMASALGVPEDVFAAADEDGERVPTVEQLVDRCTALAAARASEAEGLRAMASALGVPEDVFAAADDDGERVPTVEQLVDRCTALAAARASEAEGLRAMASALGVPEDVFAAADDDGERVPTVEQLVDRCAALAAAAAREEESAAEAAALRHVVESVVGPMQAGDGGAALAAKRAELEEAEAALSGATGKKARAAAEARVAALRAEVVELEAAEAERAAPSAEDYAAAVEERLRDLAAHDERVSNSVKSEPQVTTHHGHVFDGAEWEGVARDRPAALRDALVGDVSAACRVGAEDVSNVAFEPDTGRATFDVTHNAVVSEEEMERRLAECGYPRMYALYERRGDAVDGADALAAELAKAAAERDAELRAMARALGVPADAFAAVGSDGERVPTVEQLVDRCTALAAARASEAEGLRAMASALGVPEDVFAAADEDGERVPTVEQLVDRCAALAAACASEAEGLRAMASALGVPEDVFAAADEDGERVPTVEQLVDRCTALAAARASEAEGLRAMASALGVPEDVFAAADDDGERVPTVEQLVDRCAALAAAAAREEESAAEAAALRHVVESVVGPMQAGDGGAALAAKRAELEEAEAALSGATGKKARAAAEARVAALRAEVVELEAAEAERAAPSAEDYAAAVEERLRDLAAHDERVSNSVKSEPQVTTHHGHVFDGAEWEGVARDRPAALRDALVGDVSAACRVGAEDVSNVAFEPDTGRATFDVTHNAVVSEEEMERRLAECGYPRMYALYERRGDAVDGADALAAELAKAAAERDAELRAMARALGVPADAFAAVGSDGERVPTVEQLVDRCTALAAARASEAEGLRAMASALGVPEDVFAAADEDGERVPTVEQLVDRCTALAAARASEAEGLRAMASALGVPEDVFAAADEDGERVPTVEQLVDRCTALAAARASEAEGLRAMASALGVPEDVFAAADEDGERVPTVEQLVDRCAALAAAAAREEESAAEAAALRHVVESVVGPMQAGDGGAALAAKRAELEEAEAALSGATGKKARAAAEARVAALRAEVVELEAAEAERAAPSAEDYAAAVEERLRDLAAHDERVSNSVKSEPQVTTHHGHVFDGAEWEGVARDRPAALRDALVGDVSAACRVGAEDVSNVAFEPDTGRATFDVTHNAGVSEEEMERRLAECGYPRMYALYERRGDALDGADALAAELAKAAAERDAELRAMARALGVPADAFAGVGSDGERVPTVEQLAGQGRALRRALSESLRGEEAAAAVDVLLRLDEAVGEVDIHVEGREPNWWAARGPGRWRLGSRFVDGMCAAVQIAQVELCEITDNVKNFRDQLVDVERDNVDSREAVTAAVERLRAGLGDDTLSVSDGDSPPSSRGSTVCGPLFASLRELNSEVAEVSMTLRKVKAVLEGHNAEEKAAPENSERSFPAVAAGQEAKEGRVVTYQDVVAGVEAKVAALRRERERRLERETKLREVMDEVAARSSRIASEGPDSPKARSRAGSTTSRSLQPKAKPAGAEATTSTTAEEFTLAHAESLVGEEGGVVRLLSSEEDYAQEVRAAFQQAEDVVRAMREAIVTSYGALGGGDDLAEDTDTETAHKLVDLATVTGDNIAAAQALLLPGTGDPSRRLPLAAVLEALRAKMSADPTSIPPGVAAALESAARAAAFGEMAATSSRPSTTSSSSLRHVPRKRKPAPPERVRAEVFALAKLVRRRGGPRLSSSGSHFEMLPPAPSGRPLTASDFESRYAYQTAEVSALRRGCALAIQLLDPARGDREGRDSNALIVELMQLCVDVQAAAEAVQPLFESGGMTDEVHGALTAYTATNSDADEAALSTRCVVLARVAKSLKNSLESVRVSRANLARQQRFLIENEQQNADELRAALAEVEAALQESDGQRGAAQEAAAAAAARADQLAADLQAAATETAELHTANDGTVRALAAAEGRLAAAAEELGSARTREAALAERLAALDALLDAAAAAVTQGDVARSCADVYRLALGQRLPALAPAPAEAAAKREVLLPALEALATHLRAAATELGEVSEGGQPLGAVVAAQRSREAQKAAALAAELASAASTHEQLLEQLRAATRQLQHERDARADDVDRLQRALRAAEAAATDAAALQERRLRQVQQVAAEEAADAQARLARVAAVLRDEEAARAAAEAASREGRHALAALEARLGQLERRTAEEAAAQQRDSAQKLAALEEAARAAQEQREEVRARLASAVAEAAQVTRALAAEKDAHMAALAALAEAETQLRGERAELADLRGLLAAAPSLLDPAAATPASLSPVVGGAGGGTGPATARDLLAALLRRATELQRRVSAQQAAERQRRTRGTQSEDTVLETLDAFQRVWAAAAAAGRTPAHVQDAWLTPSDKAEVLQTALRRDDTAKLDDLASARRLLLDYVSRPTVRRFARAAVAAMPTALESAPTAALVQLYNNALHDAHDAQMAAMEKELREGRRKAQEAQQQLQELQEQRDVETAEVELRLGQMREMVQSKLVADEATDRQNREAEAAMEAHLQQLHAYAAERADVVRHVQELRRLIRRRVRGSAR